MTFTECQIWLEKGEDMGHSIRSYLQRRTTEELENILVLYTGEKASELNKEIARMTIGILVEREASLSAEYLERVRYYLDNS